MSPVFICLPTPTLGGAEKRFVGLWRHLRLRGTVDARLVVQRRLLEVLSTTPEFLPLPPEVEVFDVPDGKGVRGPMREVLRRLFAAHPRAVFHFVMITPLEVQRFASQRTVFSEAVASLDLFNWKGRLASRLGALAASKVDALEEDVVADFSRLFPFKRSAITNTPNSFVDLEFYRAAERPRDRLTFIGLFSDTKQAFRLAKAVPAIDRALKAAGVARPEFRFLGRETRSPGVADLLASFGPSIDAKAEFVTDPRATLAESKVVFSLQTVTNYPSKALLEGMACGALPVVTDVGKTRRIVTPEFAAFVPRDFSDDDIAAACGAQFALDEVERRQRVERMLTFVRQNFSIDSMAAYYQRLYTELS